MDVTKKKYAELLLKMTTLHNMKIKAYPHRSLNTSSGLVRSPELSACSSEEIKINLASIGFKENIIIRNINQLIDINSYILAFSILKLPPELKIDYMMVKVDTTSKHLDTTKARAQKRQ